jgi:hypothetical protein
MTVGGLRGGVGHSPRCLHGKGRTGGCAIPIVSCAFRYRSRTQEHGCFQDEAQPRKGTLRAAGFHFSGGRCERRGSDALRPGGSPGRRAMGITS